MKWRDGSYYDGDWYCDCMHGWGIYKDFEGIYEGEFKNDKREGKGKMAYSNTNNGTWEGPWKNDKRNGKGIKTVYGDRYVAEYEDDKYVEYVERNVERKTGRKAGRYVDADGKELGRIDSEGNLYDERGYAKGKIDEDGVMYDEHGYSKGKVDDYGRWYFNNSDKKGYITKDGDIRDNDNNVIARFYES